MELLSNLGQLRDLKEPHPSYDVAGCPPQVEETAHGKQETGKP